jgi:UDPglucose 6-dehydrogenase
VSTSRRRFGGPVYSLEVEDAETVVTSFGLVAHNCFPKDSRALVRIAEDNGYDFSLLKGVIEVNDEQFERMTSKIVKMAGGSVKDKVVAVWGLTFKARTDDTRRSPSLEVIERLQARGAKVKAYDPAAKDTPENVERADDPYAACEGAEVLAVLTEWDELRWVDFEKVAGLMSQARIVDCRNLLDPAAARRKGFIYEGLGRP